jgi:16S rRNA (cytosine1402-N4)-methyltransferase
MVRQVLDALRVQELALLNKQPIILDATLGAAGHAVEIIKEGGFVFGVEASGEMIEVARENLEKACLALNKPVQSCFRISHGNFKDIKKLLQKQKINIIDGALMDLGISSLHYEMNLGFSFSNDEDELDMRLDPTSQAVKASDLLNALPKAKLEELFSSVLSKNKSKKVAKKIVEARKTKKFTKVKDFVDIFPKKTNQKIHPATRAFLALRMGVNSEMENLSDGLEGIYEVLKKGSRLVVISFHSTEDRVVKRFMKKKVKNGSKIIIDAGKPTKHEVVYNPRSRSAILRVLEK